MSHAELYDQVLKELHGDEGTFAAMARNWIEGTEDAPFENAEALELYGKAKYYCRIWRSGAINSRKAKRQMVACVRQLAEMGLENPYPAEEYRMLGVAPEEAKIVDEPEAIHGVTLPAEKVEKKHPEKKEVVLGIVPEEKPKSFFKRHKE